MLVKEEVPDILDRLKSANLLSELFTKAEMQFFAKKEVVISDVPPVLLGAEQNFFDSGRKSQFLLHFSCFSFTGFFVSRKTKDGVEATDQTTHELLRLEGDQGSPD